MSEIDGSLPLASGNLVGIIDYANTDALQVDDAAHAQPSVHLHSASGSSPDAMDASGSGSSAHASAQLRGPGANAYPPLELKALAGIKNQNLVRQMLRQPTLADLERLATEVKERPELATLGKLIAGEIKGRSQRPSASTPLPSFRQAQPPPRDQRARDAEFDAEMRQRRAVLAALYGYKP